MARDEGDGWRDLVGLARVEAWPLERILALPGRCRGGVLDAWGEHVRRRFGETEADALRAAMGIGARELPDAPDKEGWYPVGWQLGLTRLIVDRHLGGDVLKLERLIHEDAQREHGRVAERVARLLLSPRRLLGAAHKVFPLVYDLGRAEAEVDRKRAVLRWSGAAFMAEPLWRVLQVFAVRGIFEALRAAEPACEGRGVGEAGFELIVRYRG